MDLDSSRPDDLAPAAESPRREPLDVETLTRRLVRGDEEAYRVFYDSYFSRLSRYLLVVTAGDENAALEALQGTLVRLVRYIRVFSDEAVFWSWLTVLARSCLSDERRKRRRYLAFLDRFKLHSQIEAVPEIGPPPPDRLGERLVLEVSKLPPNERQMIEQKYFEHMPVRSIAGSMNTTEKAIESSLSRIRRKLKASVLTGLKNERPN